MMKMVAASVAVLAAVVSMGCRDQAQSRNGVGACNPANSGHDCIHLNGDGVHIADTMPRSVSGLRAGRSSPWQLLGFESGGGRVIANGWYDGIGPVDAEVTAATLRGEKLEIRAVAAPGTAVHIDVADSHGAVRALDGAELGDLVLTVRVPAPSADSTVEYDLRITPAGTLAGSSPRFQPLAGYAVEYRARQARERPGAWTSYCTAPGGEAMSATLFPGAQWSPDDGTRRDGDHLVTLTCESGAVAQCALWGYAPWERAVRPGTLEVEALSDYHQACLHMKRGAYCGTEASFTRPGTAIEVSDPFGIQRTSVSEVEAIWTADGAACLSSPRDPDAGFEGCPEPLPACPPSPAAGKYLVSGLPE